MNIEFIKSEFEKLTLILRSWKEDQNISTIERDIVLDKLRNIYDTVRFADADADPAATADNIAAAAHTAATEQAPTAAAELSSDKSADMPEQQPDEEGEDGEEVEVEFIFDEDSQPQQMPEEAGGIPATDAIPEEATAAAAVAASQPSDISGNDIPAEPAIPDAAQAAGHGNEAEPQAPEIAAAEAEPSTTGPAHEAAETQPIAAAPSDAAMTAADNEAPAVPQQPHTQRPMNSLFGSDEIKRSQPSRHHRMMSIYDDSEHKQEKVVDISKIFDRDDYDSDDYTPAPKYDTREDYPRDVDMDAAPADPVRKSNAELAAENGVTTIGDTISASQHTLADTLTRPAPLAEEITHRATKSLRDAIGINDKFLLIRDLFDGDEHEYEHAIEELDKFDNLDDCMIYIVENYAWNPNSDGAKFIMQLLERKLS